jgi:small GTP-binding protein
MRRRDVIIGAGAAAAGSLSTAAADSVSRCKTVIVGDAGVGKTCALQAFATGNFESTYNPTRLNSNTTLPCTTSGLPAELDIWDVSGHEEYDNLRPLSYPQTDVFIIAFAIDSYTSLSNVQSKWHPEIDHYAPGRPVILAGMKSDLRLPNAQAIVTTASANQVAEAMHAIAYLECSARSRVGLTELFEAALLSGFQMNVDVSWPHLQRTAPRLPGPRRRVRP